MKTAQTLAKWATEGEARVTSKVACAGTAIESTSYAIGGKAFLFVQAKGDSVIVRFKLDGSLANARKAGSEVGANGWVKVTVPAERCPTTLRAWVLESRAVLDSGKKPSRTRR